ncbi:MAG TPA: cupin domain-containing protein [Ignavibacteria bacterium]|nr:cupin domain-containing protein [Ignavibacteria bacterium]HRJ98666.1 cupin domain-containing protein [Ignavibacteria bacterium]
MSNDDSTQQFFLNEGIEYQKDSVVSKTLISKKNGTVTLFAFDKGQALSEHTAPFDAMAVITEGKAGIILGGKKFIMKKDETVILPANIPHSVNSVSRFKMLLIMIRS